MQVFLRFCERKILDNVKVGYGLVEPVDEMDKPAWSPEVLHWLAEDLVAHRYDLKHTMARILTSRAYQLPAVNVGETEDNYVFRGPAIRRLSAEQFSDAIMALTQAKYPKADARFNRQTALVPQRSKPLPLTPQWIWNAPGAQHQAAPATLVFRRTVTLPELPDEAVIAIAADDNYAMRINGKAAGSSGRRNSTMADFLDVKSFWKAGENLVEVTVANLPPDDGRIDPKGPKPAAESPAGLILYARIRKADTVMDFVSDASWQAVSPRAADAAADPAERTSTAVALGGIELSPWRLGEHFLDVARANRDRLPVERAALVAADPLMTALGRPNREQVVTVRQSTATTLQVLELTNGGTLDALLKEGADRRFVQSPLNPSGLIDVLYRQAVGRPPTPREATLAAAIVGSPARREGIEDFLWALTMLPEFQLIH